MLFKIKNDSKLGSCGHGPNKSVNFIFGLGLVTWKKENLRLGLEWAFYMVNKKLFLRCNRFAKNRTVCPVRRFNRRFERFNAGLTTNSSLKRTEPESSPVNGLTDRSSPVFKTMVLVTYASIFQRLTLHPHVTKKSKLLEITSSSELPKTVNIAPQPTISSTIQNAKAVFPNLHILALTFRALYS